MRPAQRTEDVRCCLSRRPARPALQSQRILRGGVPKGSHCPVVGVLETQEVLVRAALVGLVALGQEVEGPLHGPAVFFGWLVAQPLEALPVRYLLGLLPAILPLGLGLGSPETGGEI